MGSDPRGESSPGGLAGEGGAAPLGVPMVDELLADSFLRRLFCHFYETLATAPGLDPALQVPAIPPGPALLWGRKMEAGKCSSL